MSPEELLKLNMDPVPYYIVLRDIEKLPVDHSLMIKAKENAVKVKWVKNIVDLQQDNGSWGNFHSLSTSSKYRITTEQALRRLGILGLDCHDSCIQKAVGYMEQFLNGTVDFADRKEKSHDWENFTKLIAAAQIRRFKPSSMPAMNIANKWKDIIEYAFSDNEYKHQKYEEAYIEVFSKKPYGGRLVDFVNFYPLTIVCGLLTEKTEQIMLDYVINHTGGIYYIYEDCLSILPDSFASKHAGRYLSALELLSEYSSAKEMLHFSVRWLLNNIGKDGLWDMGPDVKDNVVYPLSDSWRSILKCNFIFVKK
jgi:hypothetical protein